MKGKDATLSMSAIRAKAPESTMPSLTGTQADRSVMHIGLPPSQVWNNSSEGRLSVVNQKKDSLKLCLPVYPPLASRETK